MACTKLINIDALQILTPSCYDLLILYRLHKIFFAMKLTVKIK